MLSGIDILVNILITIPFNIWYSTAWFPTYPWPGWNAIHRNWSYTTRWMYVVYGFVFFGLFGVAAGARKHYASAWQYVSKIFCWQTKLSREPSKYVFGFVLFQSIFR
jgi:hypothetical protein